MSVQRLFAFRLLIASCLCAAAATTTRGAETPYAGYLDHDALTARMNILAQGDGSCAIETIGKSGEGRDLLMLTLAANQNDASSKPSVLITAGIDGRHLLGSELAIRLAERLLADHRELLDGVTVYVMPRLNPDAAERNFSDVVTGHIGTFRPVDDDHDGRIDEDGPQDVNGDGVITIMRRANPPLDDEATHLADPAEPRLLKKPDRAKGEKPIYAVYVEGLDADGDGLIAEDGPGGVDLDHNFMHRWPEYANDAGPYQLSENESMAIAAFVLEHKNIACAFTLGRHDNLINVPDGRGRDVTGRAPVDLHSDDVAYYKEIADAFKEITEQKHAPKEDSAGSFSIWLYAQRGVPSFASTGWGRPEPQKKNEAKEDANGEDKPKADDAEAEADPEKDPGGEPGGGLSGEWKGVLDIPDAPAPLEILITLDATDPAAVRGRFTSAMFNLELSGEADPDERSVQLTATLGEGMTVSLDLKREGDTLIGTGTGPQGESVPVELTRVAPPEGEDDSSPTGETAVGKKKDKKIKADDEDAAAWLKYSGDERAGAGFVEWTPFNHPTLGEVEIGGFVPGFQMNPPADQLDALAEKQTAFVVDLIDRLPKLAQDGPHVKKLAPGLYDIRFGIVNEGYLPTTTAIARSARAMLPTIVSISTPMEKIVSGERVNRAWGIDGSGGRATWHWIIRATDGEAITIEFHNQQFGKQSITFRAEE